MATTSPVEAPVKEILVDGKYNPLVKTVEEPVPTKAQTQSHLLCLTSELALEIYRRVFVLPYDEYNTVETITGPGFPKMPGILQTCRQTRNHAIGIYFTENFFDVGIGHCNYAVACHFKTYTPHGRYCEDGWYRTDKNDSGGVYLWPRYSEAHWPNLLEWLKQVHAGQAINPPTDHGCRIDDPCVIIVDLMFQIAFTQKEATWEVLESIFLEMRVVLGSNELGWDGMGILESSSISATSWVGEAEVARL